MNLSLLFLPSLSIFILESFISESAFIAGGTKMTLCKVLEEVLQEERERDHTRD